MSKCPSHPDTDELPDTCGYWYCPKCEDEADERKARDEDQP